MVADEHGLKMADTFGTASVAKVAGASAGTTQEAAGTAMPAAGGGGGPLTGAAEDDLEERLRKLRGS
tara:strand:+ start:628 stop:828 length:201 start_codon:yes stop_codon:yes gene_type:complete